MKNLKIKMKLLVGFGLVLTLILGLGVSSFFSMSKQRSIIKEYSHYSMPVNDLIWQLRRNMVSVQRYILMAMESPDIAVVTDSIKTAQKERAEMGQNITDLEQMINPKYLDQIQKASDLLDQAAVFRQQIEQYAQGMTPEDDAIAYDIFMNQYKPLYDEVVTILIAIYEASHQEIMDQAQTSSQASTTAIAILCVVLVISLVLTIVLIFVLSGAIATPLTRLAKAADEISKGNLNVNLQADRNDEIGTLTRSFIKVRDNFLGLTDNINLLSKTLDEGDIDYSIPVDQFEGEFRLAAEAVNQTAAHLVKDINAILDAYSEIGEGNFNVRIQQFPGKKAMVNQRFEALRSNIASVSKDIATLIQAATEGQLTKKVDTSPYKNDWKALTDGLNNLLETVNLPLTEANRVLQQLSKGNFEVNVNNHYQGSFSDMLAAMDSMVESTSSYIEEITKALASIAKGDLTYGINREYAGQFNKIKNSINNINDTLLVTISELQTSANNVLEGSRQISQTSMHLANGATDQASAIQELNASLSIINEQTHSSAEKAQQADKLSQKSITSAQDGNNEMVNMLHAMDGIKNASKEISKIIKVIDDIAFQTNILALNAAVEAARAGQHGKGFAVVAEEVRSLAGRSQQAAKETSVLIEDAIAKVNDGTQIANLTADALQTIVQDINSISEIINAITVATSEQADSISQITVGINQISDVVQSNSSTSEESAAAAEELNSQSEMMAQMVSQFKLA